jgi:HPt (histidine-containing phosphotransfer) domain-containing protein
MTLKINRAIVEQIIKLDDEANGSFLSELLEVLQKDSKPKLERLKQSISMKDSEMCERLSHNLRSSFGNLGFEEALVCLKDIEISAKSSSFDSCESNLKKIEELSTEIFKLDVAAYRSLL